MCVCVCVCVRLAKEQEICAMLSQIWLESTTVPTARVNDNPDSYKRHTSTKSITPSSYRGMSCDDVRKKWLAQRIDKIFTYLQFKADMSTNPTRTLPTVTLGPSFDPSILRSFDACDPAVSDLPHASVHC
jgi:hypothetical protein